MSRVDVDGSPAADHHDPCPAFEHLEIVAKVDVGQMFDYDIEAGPKVLHHLLLVVLVVVVEDVVGSTLGDHIHSLLGAGSSNHCSTNGPANNESQVLRYLTVQSIIMTLPYHLRPKYLSAVSKLKSFS